MCLLSDLQGAYCKEKQHTFHKLGCCFLPLSTTVVLHYLVNLNYFHQKNFWSLTIDLQSLHNLGCNWTNIHGVIISIITRSCRWYRDLCTITNPDNGCWDLFNIKDDPTKGNFMLSSVINFSPQIYVWVHKGQIPFRIATDLIVSLYIPALSSI